ncbi:MAG: class I adenylate-forming enzyme family protein [Ilumatobacter fluminis]|uniref:class I adenylate-forming enzyme family protein n=1 Tax=Ilumatobacter fluminis TaxID=467091 RepID=UPI0032EAE17F
MSATREQALATLTGPGGAFEIVPTDVQGIEMPVFRNAPPTMRAVFEQSLEFGDRTFLVYDDLRWTYADHGDRVRRLAHHLREMAGVRPGDRVAIGMRNYPEWVLAFWTTQAIGAVAVPLNAWWTGSELEYGMSDSGAIAAIVDDERLDRMRPILEALPTAPIVARSRTTIPEWAVALDDIIEVDGEPPALPHVDIAPDDPSAIMYTSGTTGLPKGAVQTHRNHCTNLTNTALHGALTAEMAGPAEAPSSDDEPVSHTIALQTFPFFHIGGLTGLYTSTAFGATLVTMYKWDATEAVRLVQAEGVTAVSGVPTVVRQLLDELDREGVVAPGLGSITSGGAPVPPHLIDRIGERSGRAIRPGNGYGLTETTSAVVANMGPDYYDHPDSVGRPVPVAEVTIRDELGNVLPDGQRGELWVRGPNVVAGYWNKPEATAEAFTDGWFHTGDAAYVRDGFVYVVDRIKDVVLRGGENVYCAEVEAAIHAIDGVLDVAVVGLPHDVLGEEVAAVVEFAPGSDVTAADIQRRLASNLAAFKVPSIVIRSAEPLPRTATGKVLKRDLRSALERPSATYERL